MSSGGEIGIQVRRPSTPGANQQILFNQGGVDGANANLTYNIAAQTVGVEANIQLSNTNSVYFGGNQGNTANANFQITNNVSSNSLDFVFV